MAHLAKALEAFQKQHGAALTKVAAAKRAKKPPGQKDGQPKASRSKARQTTPSSGATGATKAKTPDVVKQGSAPLGKQIKDVVDTLLESRDALSADDLLQKTGFFPTPGSALREALATNEKVEITADGYFLYKSKHEVRTKEQVMNLVRRFAEGIHAAEVRDAYPAAMADVEALRQEGRLWALPHPDTEEPVLYPRESPPVITVTADVAALWHEIELPIDPDAFDAELKRVGIQPIPRKGARKRIGRPPKEKKKRKFQIRHLTNVHMPELFLDTNTPATID